MCAGHQLCAEYPMCAGQVLHLMAVLSPARTPAPVNAFRLAYIWPALAVLCLLMPVCGVYTLLHPAVVWSGEQAELHLVLTQWVQWTY